jgi:hypothetical protein
MARYPAPDPDVVRFALEQLKSKSARDVAKELADLDVKVSFNTIALWARKAEQDPTWFERKEAGAVVRPSAPAKSEPLPPPPARKLNLSQALAARGDKPKSPAPAIDPTDTLGSLRELVRSMFEQANAEKLSNPKLSATLTRSASDVLNTIARVEKGQAEAEDLLRISRRQIAETSESALERFKLLCARAQEAGGMLCARCSRQLSIEWGEAHAKVAEAKASEGA